ncbi:MAG: hypothetical protein ACR2L1_02470 [Pyrinomonadaceae bacterium]
MKSLNGKIKTYFLLGAAILIGIIHTYHPVTLSPTDSGDRTNFMFAVLILAWCACAGHSFGRIGIGVAFVFAATVNLLIGLPYGFSMNSGNLLELMFWAIALGSIGLALLLWKEIRIFEEIKLIKTNLAAPQI